MDAVPVDRQKNGSHSRLGTRGRGRPRGDGPPKVGVNLRVEEPLWRALTVLVAEGKIRSKTDAVNAALREIVARHGDTDRVTTETVNRGREPSRAATLGADAS